MKTRNSLVSNSSSSSFIVRYQETKLGNNKFATHLTEIEIHKLEQFGFKKTWVFHPSDIHVMWHESERWQLSNNDKDHKFDSICYGIFVSCNENDVIRFLLENNIPFIGSCHYTHYTVLYHKDADVFMRLANFGQVVEMYYYGDFYEEIIKDINKTPKYDMISVKDFIQEEKDLEIEVEQLESEEEDED